MIFLLILLSFPAVTVLWWLLGHRLLRGIHHPWARAVRWLVGISAALHLLGIAFIIAGRGADMNLLPLPVLASTYIWSMIVVPCLLLPWIATAVLWMAIRWGIGMTRVMPESMTATTEPAKEEVGESEALPTVTRRQVLLMGAAALPPLVNIGATSKALATMDEFRVREITIEYPDLPDDLHEMTIAHVSDTHVGRFTKGDQLDAIARRTNGLNADLIAVTGDLINSSLKDLPAATTMLGMMQAPDGVWICEGNHDLFQSRQQFEDGVRGAGLNILINEKARIPVRHTSLELVGLRWGGFAGRRNAAVAENLAEVLGDAHDPNDPNAPFRLLLAHHPDAFDAAVAAGIPLTLSGHTHGGQLMLAPGIGPGTAMFRYLSGLYRKGNNALVVSNGTGNWFPLRLNAPAEIIHIRLLKTDRVAAG